MVVVLPDPLTPTTRITDGAGPSSKLPQPTRSRRNRISSARAARTVSPVAEAPTRSCVAAMSATVVSAPDVGRDQRLLQLVPGRFDDPIPTQQGAETATQATGTWPQAEARRLTPRARHHPTATSAGTSARRSERSRETAASVMVTP